MNRNTDTESLNLTAERIFEILDTIKIGMDNEFEDFAVTLEQWISRIQTIVSSSRKNELQGFGNQINDLQALSSNFMYLLESLKRVKTSTISTTNSLFDSLAESLSDSHMIEERRQLDSQNIKLEFVLHDFEIGGVSHGLLHLPNQHFIISGHNTGEISLWGKSSLQLIDKFKAHNSPIISMAFSESEKLLFTGSLGGTVNVYQTSSFPHLKHIKTLRFGKKKIFGILPFVEHGTLLVACKEGFLYVYQLQSLKLLKTLRKPGPLDQSLVYIKEIGAIAVACLGNGTIELVCAKTFQTLQSVQEKSVVQELKNIKWNPLNKELMASFAYKIIKIFKFSENKIPFEDREIFIDKPFTSKMDFLDENHMVFASFSDKLDFVRVSDGHPVKSIQVDFTFADFLLLKEERKIVVFPYQSSESKIAVIEY